MGRPFCLTITPMIVRVFLPFLLAVSMVSCIATRRTTSNLTTQEDYFQNVQSEPISRWTAMPMNLLPGSATTRCWDFAAG